MCVYDQNNALQIVTQPNKLKIGKPIRNKDSVFIYYSSIQKHFCLGISTFGELKSYISARVFLCVSMTKIKLLQ